MKDALLSWGNRFNWIVTETIFKIFRKLRNLFNRSSYFTEASRGSDSEVTPYTISVTKILSSNKKLARFRRKMSYREILEHLDYKEGKKYLERIEYRLTREQTKNLINLNKRNDHFGSPITFEYSGYGHISPTTLRYISTALEIAGHCRVSPDTSIVEIGCGYGGQAAILEKTFGVKDYTFFDLPPVLDLTERYLKGIHSDLLAKRGSFDEKLSSWDLVISNYAFSELGWELQLSYLREVLSKCNSGFMIMNSGAGNKTGRSSGKLNVNQIREYLPKMRVIEEVPQTGPDNYVIVWGDR